MIRRVFLGSVAVAFGSLMWCGVPRVIVADDAPRVSFAPLTADDIDLFRDSLKNSVPLSPRPPKISQKVSPELEGLWAGSSTNVETTIKEITLRFRPSTEELLARSVTTQNESTALLEYVDFRLVFDPSMMTFAHSNPQSGAEVKGFSARVVEDDLPTRVRMVVGQRDSSMYVAIPPLTDPVHMSGLFLCPRRFRYERVGRTGTQALHLEQSPYFLSEVKLPFEAAGRAVFESGRKKGRASVTFQVSSELPEPISAYDISTAGTAEPSLSYRPKYPFDFFRFAPHNDLQQGVNVVVEFQNKAGHVRRQNFSHVFSIHKTTEPSPVHVKVNNVSPKSDSGECYIVELQRYSWKEFDKREPDF